jgi:CheY-like chemotaxis protein
MIDKKVCLLIDDDEDDREMFAAAVAEVSSDVRVMTVENARDAIGKIRTGEIRPDFIFLDLNMPCVNGYEFLVYLKGQIRQTRIPVIVFSNVSDPLEVTRTKKLGAHAFFEKSPCIDDLKARLSELFLDLVVTKRQPASGLS